MKLRKRLLLGIIALFFIITSFEAPEFLNFHYNQTTSSAHTYSSWMNNYEHSNAETTIGESKPSFLIICGKDTLYKQITSLTPIILTIDSLHTGPLWVPLYKSIEYSASGTAYDKKFKVPGQLSTNGIIRITGICSSQQAINMIKNSIVENFASELKNHISSKH